MIFEALEPQIYITYHRLPPVDPNNPEMVRYTMMQDVPMIDVPLEWVPNILYIEKIPGYLRGSETMPPSGELWQYDIHFHEKVETMERITVSFRDLGIAKHFLKAIKEGREVDIKTDLPELLL